ncbi:hypothetical protein HGRIS_011558 [Hohenbuehelia grisea]|uniref:Uncharacterized protein n=1 Tax=Hohenbuehelia grisea TaxID=104357 RepID=A0ABR3JXH9_9AGAR
MVSHSLAFQPFSATKLAPADDQPEKPITKSDALGSDGITTSAVAPAPGLRERFYDRYRFTARASEVHPGPREAPGMKVRDADSDEGQVGSDDSSKEDVQVQIAVCIAMPSPRRFVYSRWRKGWVKR